MPSLVCIIPLALPACPYTFKSFRRLRLAAVPSPRSRMHLEALGRLQRRVPRLHSQSLSDDTGHGVPYRYDLPAVIVGNQIVYVSSRVPLLTHAQR